jgi:hypothetical protein
MLAERLRARLPDDQPKSGQTSQDAEKTSGEVQAA